MYIQREIERQGSQSEEEREAGIYYLLASTAFPFGSLHAMYIYTHTQTQIHTQSVCEYIWRYLNQIYLHVYTHTHKHIGEGKEEGRKVELLLIPYTLALCSLLLVFKLSV